MLLLWHLSPLFIALLKFAEMSSITIRAKSNESINLSIWKISNCSSKNLMEYQLNKRIENAKKGTRMSYAIALEGRS